MSDTLSPDTQAILLLTAPLIAGRGEPASELLTPREYNQLARLLRDHDSRPTDLLGPKAAEVIARCGQGVEPARLERLLNRGFLLSQAVERWQARSIWVISRADASYPARLKTRLKEQAPAILYGCGDRAVLDTGGLAIVGSRHVDQALIEYTEGVGRLAAEVHCTVVSGGARGIDQAAMRGALESGGLVSGVLADSLERAALAREHREMLMDGRLVLVSPYDPLASFNVGHAMQRNKLVYALACRSQRTGRGARHKFGLRERRHLGRGHRAIGEVAAGSDVRPREWRDRERIGGASAQRGAALAQSR